jgi:glycosyltransferase involved in cell wall biosynthesis
MLFSIIVRTYNRKNIISKTLNSIFSQTYKNYEIIIVDDCSIDNTEQLIKKKYFDTRIKYFKSRKNLGHIISSEIGLKKSSGDIICFLDSDDIWHKSFLKEHYKIYKKFPDIDCVYNKTQTIINERKYETHSSNVENYCYQQSLSNLYIASQIAVSFKKKCWKYLGSLDRNMPREDDDLCLRLSKKFKFKFINKFLSFAIHVNSSKGITKTSYIQALGYEKLFRKYFIDIKKYCSKKEIANHFYLLAKKFIFAKEYDKSLKYINSSFSYNRSIKNILTFIYIKYLMLFFRKF